MDHSKLTYVYFRFYHNSRKSIDSFKEEIIKENLLIVDILDVIEMSMECGGIQVVVYVETQEDADKFKNDKTLKVYQKYVDGYGIEGYKVS